MMQTELQIDLLGYVYDNRANLSFTSTEVEQ